MHALRTTTRVVSESSPKRDFYRLGLHGNWSPINLSNFTKFSFLVSHIFVGFLRILAFGRHAPLPLSFPISRYSLHSSLCAVVPPSLWGCVQLRANSQPGLPADKAEKRAHKAAHPLKDRYVPSLHAKLSTYLHIWKWTTLKIIWLCTGLLVCLCHMLHASWFIVTDGYVTENTCILRPLKCSCMF